MPYWFALDLSCTNKAIKYKMTTTANHTTSNKTIKMILILALLFVSVTGMAQDKVENPIPAITTTTAVESSSSLNMISWFMGTKQNTNSNEVKEANSKKQMITNGIAPNRLLIKTFLKKATQHASNIA